MSSSTAPAPAPAPTVRSIIYLGMDVHKDSITIAVLPGRAKTPTRLERLPNDLAKLKKWIARVARDGEVRRLRAAPRTHRVGLRLRRHRALADPQTLRRAAEA